MSDKIVDLEIKITHLEQSNQELSDVYYQQQKQIDYLQKQIALLKEQLQQQVSDIEAPNIIDEPPPHY